MPPHRVYIETHLGGGAVMRHKRPAERSIGIERDPEVVRRWRAQQLVIPGLEIWEGDALASLREFPFVGDELVYADPPYVRSARRRRGRCYRFDYDDGDHVALLSTLRQLPCAVVISGYASDLYAELLPGWRTHNLAVATHAGLTSEILWCNFEAPLCLHDHRFAGEDFRDRERIRRRVDRWVGRLECMEPVERSAIVSAVIERFVHIPADARVEPAAARASTLDIMPISQGARS